MAGRYFWASCISHFCLCQDFEEGCSGLLRCGALSAYDHKLIVNEQEQDAIGFLASALEPFIETYQVVRADIPDTIVFS